MVFLIILFTLSFTQQILQIQIYYFPVTETVIECYQIKRGDYKFILRLLFHLAIMGLYIYYSLHKYMYTGMSVISTPDIKRHQGEEHSISLVEGREKPLGVSLHYVIVQANIIYLYKYQGIYS